MFAVKQELVCLCSKCLTALEGRNMKLSVLSLLIKILLSSFYDVTAKCTSVIHLLSLAQ